MKKKGKASSHKVPNGEEGKPPSAAYVAQAQRNSPGTKEGAGVQANTAVSSDGGGGVVDKPGNRVNTQNSAYVVR
jgi:hypothetical protein